MTEVLEINGGSGVAELWQVANMHFGEGEEIGPIDFRAFGDVSDRFLEGYASVVRLGLPSTTVAAAMMGATLNFYQVFGMSERLPIMLRAMADLIENRGEPS